MPCLSMQTAVITPSESGQISLPKEDCDIIGERSMSFPSEETLCGVASHFEIMRSQESSAYIAQDYLARTIPPSAAAATGQHSIDAICREKMCEWSYSVIDHTGFSRSVVEVAFSILDRFLSTSHHMAQKSIQCRKTYQLAAMTCLYTAIKINEPTVFDPKIVSGLGRGCVSEESVVAMERHILEGLEWRVTPFTSSSMIHSLLELLPANDQVKSNLLSLALYQSELAVGDYELVPVRTSSIALCSVLNAIQAMESMLCPTAAKVFLQNIQEATKVDIFTSVGVGQVMDRLSQIIDANVDTNQVQRKEDNSAEQMQTVSSEVVVNTRGRSSSSAKVRRKFNDRSLSPTCVMREAEKAL